MQTASPKGARYYILFKDDYSRYKVVYFLKNKSEAAETFMLFKKNCFVKLERRWTHYDRTTVESSVGKNLLTG